LTPRWQLHFHWNALETSPGDVSPSAVGDRLGKELGELIGDPLGVVEGPALGYTYTRG
jgi:hypothetical protein